MPDHVLENTARPVLNATAAHAKTRCPVPAQRASVTQPYETTTNGNGGLSFDIKVYENTSL